MFTISLCEWKQADESRVGAALGQPLISNIIAHESVLDVHCNDCIDFVK